MACFSVNRPRKRWVLSPGQRQQQLELDLRYPRRSFLNLLRSDGGRLLVASGVAIATGIVVHQHLFLVMMPVSLSLLSAALLVIRRQKKKGECWGPLVRVSLIHVLSTQGYLRPKKYSQKRLDV